MSILHDEHYHLNFYAVRSTSIGSTLIKCLLVTHEPYGNQNVKPNNRPI